VLSLNPTVIFQKVCDKVDQYLGGNHSKYRDPHLSLLYSHLDCDKVINNETTFRDTIPEIVEICGIAVVELRGQPGDWKIMGRKNFRDL